MGVHLVCDHCGRSDIDRDTRGIVEIRHIGATNTGDLCRADYPIGQVHEDCIVDFLTARKAKAEEVPF